MKTSSYVFGAALAAGTLNGFVKQVEAGTFTQAAFSFEGLGTGSTTTSSLSYAADVGTGTAFGVHASASTAFSAPGGNGSAKAFSSNTWAVGDYYQFSVPTTGIQDILLTFDQSASSTGPKAFNLAYSVDGTNFSTAGGYQMVYSTYSTTNGTTTSVTSSVGFAAGSSNTLFSYSFDLSTVTVLNNASAAFFRLIDASVLGNSGSASVPATGTNRIDNFVLSGNAVSNTPEPASLALIAAGGLLAARRRRS